MKNVLATCLIAGALALAVTVPPATAQTPSPGPALQTNSATMQHLNRGTLAKAKIAAQDAGKPMVIVAVSSKCLKCVPLVESLLDASAKHPEMVIATVDADSFGIPTDKLPLVNFFVPTIQRGPIFQKFNFAPSDTELDAFLVKYANRGNEMIRLNNDNQRLSDSAQPLLARLGESYARGRDDERLARADLNEQLAAVLENMADNHHKIGDMLQQENDASDK